MDEFFQFFQSFTFVSIFFSQVTFLSLFGQFMEYLALKVLDGDYHIYELFLLVTMPLGVLLLGATVVGAPLYIMWLLYSLPHIIYCFGRVVNPDYPECSGRSRLPELNRGHAGNDIVAVGEGEQGSDGSSQVNFDDGI